MKTQKLRKLLTLVSLFTVFSVNAQVYEKGDMLIDAYIGWPNFYTISLKTAYRFTKDYDVHIKSFGPVGGKIEYLFSHKIGVGLNVNYAYNSIYGSFRAPSTLNMDDLDTFNYKATVTRLRIMPSVNFHLGKSKRVDPYFSFALGYASRKFKIDVNYPHIPELKLGKSYPIGYRVEFGTRFFFTKHLGANLQIGFGGGPLIAAGLSAKF